MYHLGHKNKKPLTTKSIFLQNRLDDIINDWEETVGKGYCHCQYCKNESVSYPGECPEYMSKCNRERPFDFYGNETVREFCKNVECASCKAVSLLCDIIIIAFHREGLTMCTNHRKINTVEICMKYCNFLS